MQKKVFAGLAALSFGLAACGPTMMPALTGNLNGVNSLGARKAGQAAWTVLVHLGGDNNLYRFALEDMNEMEAGFKGQDVNIIVLYDGTPKGDSAVYKIKADPTGPVNAGFGGIISEKIDDGGALIPASKEIDSGDPKLAAKFAEWAVKKFPAQHYMVTYWDHGSGLFGGKVPTPTRGFVWDDNGTHMKTKDLTTIMGAAAKAAGKPIDLFGFDACLMGHLEMAYQGKGSTSYMVASQELEPGKGWDYKHWVGALCANPAWNGAQLGKAMVEGYLASYSPGGSAGQVAEATLSTVDVNMVTGKLTQALNTFADVLVAAYPANKAALDSLRAQTAMFENRDCADLGDFLKLVKGSALPANVKAAAADVEKVYNQAVVANGGINGTAHRKATGMSIYFPTPTQPVNAAYLNPAEIAFGAENWKSYLNKTHGK